MKLFQKIWHFFTCDRYMSLASKCIDKPLGWQEKPGFWLHHLICTFCRRGRRQLVLIERGAALLEGGAYEIDSSNSERLSQNIKDEMRRKLHRPRSDEP